MTKNIRIAFPRLSLKGGPNIFMQRLRESIIRQNLAIPRSYLIPFYDIALFHSSAHSYYNKPYVLRMDGIYFGEDAKDPEKQKNNDDMQCAMDGARGIVYQSRFDKQLIETCFGKIKKESIVICNGAEIEYSDSKHDIRKDLGLPENRRLLICAAGWRRHKRLPEIVEVLKRLNNIEDNYALIILGEQNEYTDTNNIYSFGNVNPENIARYYQCADAYIHLSWLDHCPNTVVEAIANGLPVLCSNQGGTREIVEGASAGIVSQCDTEVDLFNLNLYEPPAPDWDQLIQSARQLFDNYEEYCREINRSFVDIDVVAKKYVNFIKKLI